MTHVETTRPLAELDRTRPTLALTEGNAFTVTWDSDGF
jgi:hypothetical protein